jgi:hypothetical protein
MGACLPACWELKWELANYNDDVSLPDRKARRGDNAFPEVGNRDKGDKGDAWAKWDKWAKEDEWDEWDSENRRTGEPEGRSATGRKEIPTNSQPARLWM